MATVQVDLSEYDMLRHAKDKAEKEVEELKEIIKGLKDKSRVILTTQYVYPEINQAKFKSELLSLYDKMVQTSPYSRIAFSGDYMFSYCLDSIIESNIKYKLPFPKNYSSSQYIGFEDVKAKVEEYYKNRIDKAIVDYEASRDDYYKLMEKAEEHAKEMYSNDIDKLKKEKEELMDKHNSAIKAKEEEIEKLNENIAELSKSNEERIFELESVIKNAEAKMRELTGIKKTFFNRIFK